MNLENCLSVPAISFQERLVEFGGFITAKIHDHRSVIVTYSGEPLGYKKGEAFAYLDR